jgi:large subunit ribosomal protein L9
MKIIFIKDVENIGKKYEVKEVKDGYARNFLIPNNLAKIATEKNIMLIEKEKRKEDKNVEEELKEIQEIASKMDGIEVNFSVKIGKENQLFESITSQKIADKLKKMGYEIKKNQIKIEENIKELGEFPVKIKFEHNLETEIRIIVTEDK